jgi:hypothetical protein
MEPSARQWLFSMMETVKADYVTRMVVALWAIRHARIKVIHEDIFQIPMTTHLFVESFLQDLGVCQENKVEVRRKRVVSSSAPRWIPPLEGSCKVIVDEAVAKASNYNAIGGGVPISRSHAGVYQGALAVVIDGITHPGCLEKMACCPSMGSAECLNFPGMPCMVCYPSRVFKLS